jgi:hypothetical protein
MRWGRGRITGDECDRKARELKERQTEITLRIEQHQKGEGDYRTTLETLISVASRAAELFERSKTEQKRELLAFVFVRKDRRRPPDQPHLRTDALGLSVSAA